MSSPFSSTRFVRWRIRDWASCFYACRFPVDEESQGFCCSALNMYNGNNNGQGKKDKELSKERSKQEQVLRENSSGNDDEGVIESSWPSFDEEDYIVFCFEEDGAINMVKEMKSEPSNHITRFNSNSKISFSEYEKNVKGSKHEDISNEETKNIYPTNDEHNYVFSSLKAMEKSSNHLNANSAPDANGTNLIESTKECKDVSAEPSDSSGHSDSSTSSFAFPVVSWEWMGSPVQMAKSEHMRFSKYKLGTSCLGCCRSLKPS